MSLAQQLAHLQTVQTTTKISPHQQQPTLILNARTANTTSQDLIYTLAIIAYSKLMRDKPSLKIQGDIVMSNQNRQINRNKMFKEANRQLSEKLIKFLLKISPYFLTAECQKIIEYLLNNYKINIFQGQALAIIYLQYWNTPIYQKLISNIPTKILSSKLAFLNKQNQKDVFNITYIIKSLAYSHHLISTLILYTLQYLRTEEITTATMDIEINLHDQAHSLQPIQNLMRCDPKRFLLTIFNGFFDRRMISCYKYMLQFLGKAAGMKSLGVESLSMIMVVTTRLLVEDAITNSLLANIHLRLINKSFNLMDSQIISLYHFTLIIFQRRPQSITHHIVMQLQNSASFKLYIIKFKHSLWTVLLRLLQLFIEGAPSQQIIQIIGKRIKNDEFYLNHQQKCHDQLFGLLESAISVKSQQHHRLQFIQSFYQKYYLHELATYYHNKQIFPQLRDRIVQLFEEKYYEIKNNCISFDLKLIPKDIIKKQPQINWQEQKKVSSQEQQQKQEEQIEKPKQITSLLGLLKEKGFKIEKINFNDGQIKKQLVQMIEQHYNGGRQLDLKGRNKVFQEYPQIYNERYFILDIKTQNLVYPIKHLCSKNNTNLAKQVLLSLVQNFSLFNNILYKELFRLALSQLSLKANTNYKEIIYFINSLFKKLTHRHLAEQQNGQLVKLSQMLIRISEQILRSNLKKGKYHKLLHNHGRLIAEMLMNLKSKEKVVRIKIDLNIIINHYSKVVSIFTQDNLYLLNIGIIETLTKKVQHNYLQSFIRNIVYESLKHKHLDYYYLIKSIIKSIIFTSKLNANIAIDQTLITSQFSGSIAKNSIVDFFGITKQKFKRVMTKKVFLYVKNIFESSFMIQRLKGYLNEINEGQLQKLLSLLTQLYRLLGLISSKDEQINKISDIIQDKITNILPLKLRIIVFKPLLPNHQLYHYLAEQLAEHSHHLSNFEELAPLVNIVPEEVTYQWTYFMKQCFKRGNQPSEQLIARVIDQDLNGSPSNLTRFICDISEYYPDLLHSRLQHVIKIIKHHLEKPNDFTLAIIVRLIINLGQILDPYLTQLVMTCLNTQSQYIQTFVNQVTLHLSQPTLITMIKSNYKTAAHISNFSLFFKAVVIRGVGDSLNKTLLNLMKRTLFNCLENQQNPEQIIKLQSEIYVEIGLKMTQNQLRKAIIQLVRWCESKSQKTQGFPFNPKNLFLTCIFGQFSQKLQELFNNFYGYILESVVKDYNSICGWQQERGGKKSKGLKRMRQEDEDYKTLLNSMMLKISLKAIKSLFNNDRDHQFIDSIKVEQISSPIIQLLQLALQKKYKILIEQSVIPTIKHFYQCIVDDYQMKNINLKVLLLLRNKNPDLLISVFRLINSLIQSLKERFLILTSDVVPFLMQCASSREQQVSGLVRKIILKIQQLSGEQIHVHAK